eukprot:5438312-Lingulodinium_polyedra.AAC.1
MLFCFSARLGNQPRPVGAGSAGSAAAQRACTAPAAADLRHADAIRRGGRAMERSHGPCEHRRVVLRLLEGVGLAADAPVLAVAELLAVLALLGRGGLDAPMQLVQPYGGSKQLQRFLRCGLPLEGAVVEHHIVVVRLQQSRSEGG